MTAERFSPLLDVNRDLGARIVAFAGWEMPLQFTGIVAEHNAVRTSVGVFDVSHLGKLRVEGAGAATPLQAALTADIGSLDVGRATYSLVLADDGGCIDDVFVYRLGENEWLVVPNAANVGPVAEAIADAGAGVEDEWDRWAIIAIQGPKSFDLVADVFPGSNATDLKLHSFTAIETGGGAGLIARTGYTGERGFELYAPASVAPGTYRALLEAGGAPVGLGARDTLRLEMGYALYGHELTRDVNPLEANLGWVLAWDTPFRGKDALAKIKADGPARKIFGVRCIERGVPRQGYEVMVDVRAVGELTSGNFSPTLSTGIGLALGPVETLPGPETRVGIAARGRLIAADIVKPPFIER